jgi:hypothetical protein
MSINPLSGQRGRPGIDDFDREIVWPPPDPRDSTLFAEAWALKLLQFKVLVHMEKRDWPFTRPQNKIVELTEPGQKALPGGGWLITRVEFEKVDNDT